MTSLLKRLIREDRGAAIVEATIVLPLLLTLGFGVLQFSNAFYDHQQITTGIRDAARYLARVPNPNNGAAQANAQNLAVYGNIGGTGPARVPAWTIGQVTPTITTVANPSAATGNLTLRGPDPLTIIVVSAAVPYPGLGFLTYLGLASPTINITHSERWIGG